MVEMEIEVRVKLDGKNVGIIKNQGDGFRYFPSGKGKDGAKYAGAPYKSPEDCMLSVVGDDNHFLVNGKIQRNKGND